jgi:RNA polymerase sigma-70 factor, ECF subfamily
VPSQPSILEIPTAWIARIRLGDREVFGELFRRVHSPLCRFAERYVGDAARAEELVQDLFLDLWARRDTITVQTNLRAYLFASVRNRALNIRRRDNVERDWADDEAQPSVRALHAAPPPADWQAAHEDEYELLRNAMASLPPRCALVMHLRWTDGLSYAEIASVLDISVKGVEQQLARGLRTLRTLLHDRASPNRPT